MRDRLEQIAALIRALDSTLRPTVQLGISDDNAMTLLKMAGAPLHKTVYDDAWTVIESRTITISGVQFYAQADMRSCTDEEKATYLDGIEADRRAEELEKQAAELREQARRAIYGDKAAA